MRRLLFVTFDLLAIVDPTRSGGVPSREPCAARGPDTPTRITRPLTPVRFSLRARPARRIVPLGATATNPDCRADDNYGVAQYSGRYPLVLHPGSTQLSSLVPDSSAWPHVSMHDLRTNQDVCQGAVLALAYSGLATR